MRRVSFPLLVFLAILGFAYWLGRRGVGAGYVSRFSAKVSGGKGD